MACKVPTVIEAADRVMSHYPLSYVITYHPIITSIIQKHGIMASLEILPPSNPDTPMGTSWDQSLLNHATDSLCLGLLAERHVGYPSGSSQQDSTVDGSRGGCDGTVARPVVSLLPNTANRECVHQRSTHVSSTERNVNSATVDQSSMANPVESSRGRRRSSTEEELVEPCPKRPRRDSASALGHVILGKEAPLSHRRVCGRRSHRQQWSRMAESGGIFGRDAPTNFGRQHEIAPQPCHAVPSLARYIPSNRTSPHSRGFLGMGCQGGAAKRERVSELALLRMDSSKSGYGGNYSDTEGRGSGGTLSKYQQPLVNVLAKTTPGADASAGKTNCQERGKTNQSSSDYNRSDISSDDKASSNTSKGKVIPTNNNSNNNDDGSNDHVSSLVVRLCHLFRSIDDAWTWFFFARTTDLKTVAILRAAYAAIVIINLSLLWLDLDWFLHVMPSPLARQTMDPDTLCLFDYLQDPIVWPKLAVILWGLHAVFLGVGNVAPRWQAFGIFFWQTQIAHHNSLLWDGEDFVMRLLAFFMIFYPNNAPSLWGLLFGGQKADASNEITHDEVKSWPMVRARHRGSILLFLPLFSLNLVIMCAFSMPQWPFRLVQIQVCLIYFSTGGLKVGGYPWAEGYALYQVVHNDGLYGGWFNPEWMFGYTRPLEFLTRATIWHELGVLPLFWFGKTRKLALVAVIGFHLMLDASMNLNMFHWVMIVGWCTFLIQPSLPPKPVC